MYSGTKRAVQIALKVVASDEEEAQQNLVKTSTLTRMLYPEYSSVENANTISKSPLLKIKFANLIYDASRGPGGDVRTSGLLGAPTSFTWAPDIEQGFFDPSNRLYPKMIAISIGLEVLHQHSLGWQRQQTNNDGTSDTAPRWGSDAALFPWSSGVQKANTQISNTTVQDIALAGARWIMGS